MYFLSQSVLYDARSFEEEWMMALPALLSIIDSKWERSLSVSDEYDGLRWRCAILPKDERM